MYLCNGEYRTLQSGYPEMAGTILSVSAEKCKLSADSTTIRRIMVCQPGETFKGLVEKLKSSECGPIIHCVSCAKDESGPWHEVDDMPIETAVSLFGLKYVRIRCECQSTPPPTFTKQNVTKVRDAFAVLMSARQTLPAKKSKSARATEGLTKKGELFNSLVDDFQDRNLLFPTSTAETEGSYFIQVLCNALWHITSHHDVINAASQRRRMVYSIPQPFTKFRDFEDLRQKKKKRSPLRSSDLHSHAQALYSLCLKPQMKTSKEWTLLHDDIKALADCFDAYHVELDRQNIEISGNHALEHPVRQVADHTTVEHRQAASRGVQERYCILDQVVNEGSEPVVFDESIHLHVSFDNKMQRHRFLEDLQLSVPINIMKYSPGGSCITTVVIARTVEDQSTSLTDAVQMLARVKHLLPEYHTRTQRREFKKKLSRLAQVTPSIADLIYRELALDASVASHPETQQRLRLIFLGEKGLIQDLRQLNAGPSTGKFDFFFEKLAEIVENVTAADERRHNLAHLSEWISLKDLIKQATAKCPDNTPIPSSALVRLQFAPRNPYVHAALTFTNRIQVQYKIQRRQLRVSHPDDHYCAAQFRYMKEKAVELKAVSAVLCCDDKAKIPVGDPGVVVSTGVRGKKTLAPTSTTFVACDHDMNTCHLTPSVYLQCNVPTSADKSFVRGNVTVTVNDSVFQSSSPFRHAVNIKNVLKNQPDIKILMKYSDGGTDQRNTLEAVKCSAICLFKQLNLDTLILARCAPGHSWVNPAERVMSILNLGLQNCSLERNGCSKQVEDLLKSNSSMAKVRTLAEKNPAVREEWVEAVEPVQSLVRNRFLRLSLKEEQFSSLDPPSDEDITDVMKPLQEMFPELNVEQLQKKHTAKVKQYQGWPDVHCRQRQYSFQIRKCKQISCCEPQQCPDDLLKWLPDPVLDEDGEHYKKYSSVKEMDTTEKDRPTLKLKAGNEPRKRKVNQMTTKGGTKKQKTLAEFSPATEASTREVAPTEAVPTDAVSANGQTPAETLDSAPIPLTGQNARYTAECVECRNSV